MSEELFAFEWLKRNLETVQILVTAGKGVGKNGLALDEYLFERLVPLMRTDGVIPESLPRSVSEFKATRKQALIEFPRGRATGQSLDAGLAKAGDQETRRFLAGLPADMKFTAGQAAEKQVHGLLKAIGKIIDRFPDLKASINREELTDLIYCALNGTDAQGVINAFTLRILRTANVSICVETARTMVINSQDTELES
jgi:hypothetical protein